MPSQKRNLAYNTIHHVYNRGVLKQCIFHNKEDYKRFIGKIIKYRKKYPIEIKAFCLMPNHFHFLLIETGAIKPNIPRFMQQLQNSYAKYYSKKYNHSGRLVQGTYKNKQIKNENQYIQILQYIYNNPVKAKLVDKPEKWKWKFKAPLR